MATATIFSDNEPVAVHTKYGESASATLKAAGARWDSRERAWMAPAELVRRLAATGGIQLKDWTVVDTSRLVAYCAANEDREAFWALAHRIGDELRELPYRLEFSASGKSCWAGIDTRSFAATVFARFDGEKLVFEAKLVDDVPAEVAAKFNAVAEQFNAIREENQ
jgi:hypothetical protein